MLFWVSIFLQTIVKEWRKRQVQRPSGEDIPSRARSFGWRIRLPRLRADVPRAKACPSKVYEEQYPPARRSTQTCQRWTLAAGGETSPAQMEYLPEARNQL